MGHSVVNSEESPLNNTGAQPRRRVGCSAQKAVLATGRLL